MERIELDSLLMQYHLEFIWEEDRRVWWLSGKSQQTEPQKAQNYLAAQYAAIQHIENRMTRPSGNYMNYPTLDALLTKHQMSFHWSDVGRKWFVIWQEKGGNSLEKSDPQIASDRWEAQVAAALYIINKFSPAG